jgi:hypothetical protein
MIPDGMDVAAEQAAEEFNKEWSAKEVAIWWKKWYKHAGHKRLGRILVGKS